MNEIKPGMLCRIIEPAKPEGVHAWNWRMLVSVLRSQGLIGQVVCALKTDPAEETREQGRRVCEEIGATEDERRVLLRDLEAMIPYWWVQPESEGGADGPPCTLTHLALEPLPDVDLDQVLTRDREVTA